MKVTDPDLVSTASQRYAAGGWPCEVDESGTALTAPVQCAVGRSAAVAPLPRDPTKTTAVQVHDPGGATSWSFDE